MKLHDTLTNKQCIGREVTAQPDINREWITYSASNEGEENYYRDYQFWYARYILNRMENLFK